MTGGEDQYSSSTLRGAPDETSTTASILSGVPGRAVHPSGANDTLDTNKPLPREPTDAEFTGLGGASAGPHSSSLANQVDPRVDSDHDRSRGIDHDRTAESGLAGYALPDRSVGRYVDFSRNSAQADSISSSGYGTDPQPTDSTLGRDAGLGTGAVAGVGAGTAAALHHKRDQDDLRAESGRSFPLSGNTEQSSHGTGITGGTTAGPHSSSLANKADPRVDSDLDGSRTAGNTGYGSGTGPVAGVDAQGVLGRHPQPGSGTDTGNLASGQTAAGHGPESWKHDHVSHGHEFAGDPCHHGAVKGDPTFTQGPHATDTANLLDPHVTPKVTLPSASIASAPDRGLGSNASAELGSTGFGGDPQGREIAGSEPIGHGDHHHGRDAVLAGGLGAAGASAYATSRDDTPSGEHTSNTAGPHKASLLDKLDPRVHTDSKHSEAPATTAQTSGLIGSSEPGSSSHMPSSEAVEGSPGYSRDAALAGAGGVAGYESHKHSTGSEPVAATTSSGVVGPSDATGTNPRRDYNQDVRSGAGGLGSGETDSDLHKEKGRGLASRLPGFLGGHHDKSKESTGLGQTETTAPTTTKDYDGAARESDPGHHFIRDAGLASAGVGGGLAAYETQKVHSRDDPVTTTEPPTHRPAEYGNEDRIADTRADRDPAIAGGVATGSGASDGPEFSKREAEKSAAAREEEFEKEQKAIRKEHEQHEKALEKEEKRLEKEEKKHEKELAKEEKKHHHDEGKKHGGILGIFHRDKKDGHDDDVVADQHPDPTYPGTAAPAGVDAGVEPDKPHHEPHKLHKDPPAGYYESKGYQPPATGDESLVTGGAGTTGTVPGNEYSTGSHQTGTGDNVDPK